MSQSVLVTYNCASMPNLYTSWISPLGKMSGKSVIQVNLACGNNFLYRVIRGVVRITSPMAPNFMIRIFFSMGV